MTGRIKGKIIKVHPSGYGFIISDEIKFVKFFFHWTGLSQNTKFPELKPGMKVEFVPINLDELRDGNINRGPRAIKIEVIT